MNWTDACHHTYPGPWLLSLYSTLPRSKIALHGRHVRFPTATESVILLPSHLKHLLKLSFFVFSHSCPTTEVKKAVLSMSHKVLVLWGLGDGCRTKPWSQIVMGLCPRDTTRNHVTLGKPSDHLGLRSPFFTWEELPWLCQLVDVMIK